MFLEIMIDILAKSFPAGWEKQNAEAYSPIALDPFIKDFHKALNLSVLTGEYIEGYKTVPSIANLILNIINEFDDQNEESQNFSDVINLLYYFVWSLVKYHGFVRSIRHKLFEANHTISVPNEFQFSEFREDVEVGLNRLPFFGLKEQDGLFDINLKIAFIDHNYSASIEVFDELSYQRGLLDRYKKENYSFLEFLQSKADVLLQKAFRVIEDSTPNVKLFDGFYTRTDDFINPKTKYYTKFIEESKFFTPQEELSSAAKARIKIALNNFKTDSELKFIDFKLLIRSIQIEKKPQVTHTDILKKFQKYEKTKFESKSYFCINAYETTHLYIQNNYLSFLIRKKFPDNEIISEFEDIEAYSENRTLVNYFPYLKFCQYLINKFEILVKQKSRSTDIPALFEQYEDISKKLEIIFYLSSEKKIIPFQAPFDECCESTEFEGGVINLFLASSYCLPLDFSTTKKKVDYIISRLELMKLKQELISASHSYEIRLEEANSQIKNQNKSQIEILSIFAAIVLFVASNIQIFPKVNSLKQALLFTITEAYCLGIFVMLVWFVTRGNLITDHQKQRLPWTHISLFVFFALVTAILTLLIIYLPASSNSL